MQKSDVKKTYKKSSPKTYPKQYATKTYVKSLVSKESKSDIHYVDTVLSDTSIPTADVGTLTRSIIQVSRGDSQTQRTGKMLQLCSIQIRGNLYRDPVSTTHDRVRLMLVQVMSTDSTIADDIRGVIQTENVVGARQTDVQAMRRIDAGKMKNYKVLRDWYIDLGYNDTEKNTQLIDYYKKFKTPKKIWYEDSAAARPTQNNIILTSISDSGTGNPLLGFTARCTFIA